MERRLNAEMLGENGGNSRKETPDRTRWQRFKDKLKEGAIVVGIAAAAASCVVSCSSDKSKYNSPDASTTDTDSEVDTDTDTDVDTDTDTDSDTDTDTDVDTDTDTDTDVDTDSDTDTDTDTDTDSDTDTDVDTDSDTDTDTDTDTDVDSDTDTDTDSDAGLDAGEEDAGTPYLGFEIEDAEIVIAKEKSFGTLTILGLDPDSKLLDGEGYMVSLTQIYGAPSYPENPATIAYSAVFPELWFMIGGPINNIKEQGTNLTFTIGETKYVQLYATHIAEDTADLAFTEAPIILTQGAYVDLGNGIAGTVSIRWKNVSGEQPLDPQYIAGIEINATDLDAGVEDGGAAPVGALGAWLPSAPVTSGLGVPVCPGDEGLGVTGVVFAACIRPDTVPTARVQIEFNGEIYSVIGVKPPGGLY